MDYLKDFARNLILLGVIGIVLFFAFPDLMQQVTALLGALFGPVAVLVFVAAALPKRRR